MKSKQVLAAILAAALTAGSSTAFAVEVVDTSNSVSIEGTGKLEGFAEVDVTRVVLPTMKLDYKLDPQGLIKASKRAAITDTTIKMDYTKDSSTNITASDDATAADDGFVFFTQAKDDATGKTTVYSPTAKLTALNKSSFDVDIQAVVHLELGNTNNAVAVSTINDSGTDPELLFSVDDGTTSGTLDSDVTCTASSIAGIPDAYSFQYDTAKKKYMNVLNEKLIDVAGGTNVPGEYTLTIDGECNPNGAWGDITDFGKLSVVWTVAKS